MAKRSKPGVTPLGGGKYRIRTEVRHPKTERRHEIDRIVEAKSASDAATALASVRAAWLKKRRRAEPVARRRLGPTLADWLDVKRPRVRPSTAATYASAVTWWTTVLGDYYLDAIEPLDIQDALDGASEGGEAPDTVGGRLRVLRTAARAAGYPLLAEGVRVVRTVHDAERQEDEGRGLSLAELRGFLRAGPMAHEYQGEPTKSWRRAWALVATLAWTGLRFGEASALEWGDINLKAGTIRVRRAQWRGIVGHPKAAASKRTVVISEDLVDTLREHRAAMVAHQQIGVELPLVFPSRRKGAKHVSNTHARKAILRVCAAAKIELEGRPTVHMLRHTANNLVRQNASELVRQALIGHADEAIGERYSSVTLEERRAAHCRVVRMVKGEER